MIRTTLIDATREGASTNGNPKWALLTTDGTYHTQADAACSYDVDNLRREAARTGDNTPGILVTLYTTKAGRVWGIDRGHTPATMVVTVKGGNGKRAPWDNGMSDGHPHFRVRFTVEERSWTIDYWGATTDTAETVAARPGDVVECVDSDANAGRESFRDFCDDLGYNEDSRKAHRTWVACKRVAARWDQLLGGWTIGRDNGGEIATHDGRVVIEHNA